jgi:hypothetical protein
MPVMVLAGHRRFALIYLSMGQGIEGENLGPDLTIEHWV